MAGCYLNKRLFCIDNPGQLNVFLPTSRGALVLDATPSKVGNYVHDVAITFQHAEKVSELGAATRKNMHAEGFVSRYTFHSIIGESPQIAEAKETAREFAANPGTVLLAGETGTGKELFAHAIHSASLCSQGPFIPINCAAIPPSLLESELFGYEEGAFTGAMRKGKPGIFELAHKGSIFLDEISELKQSAQLRLLRVLQERCVMRLGSSKLIPVDIRVIAATNKNLWQMVEEGKFRKDLYYRLNVLPLLIPALRDRTGDIRLLAQHFLDLCGKENSGMKLREKDLQQLEEHSWPGNVRELQNVIERFTVSMGMPSRPTPEIKSLLNPQEAWTSLNTYTKISGKPLSQAQQVERDKITIALHQCGGQKKQAADLLGINRSTLFRKMQYYTIE